MKILAAVAGVLLVAFGGALAWLGAFAGVAVEERTVGPWAFVYVQEAGTDAGRIDELTRALGERLDKAGYTRRQRMQIYYPAGRGIQNQIGFQIDRLPGDDVLTLGADTFFRRVPEQRCLVARFPYRMAASYRVGQLRVEPAFRERRAERKYAETHTIVLHEGDTLLYAQPVEPGQ